MILRLHVSSRVAHRGCRKVWILPLYLTPTFPNGMRTSDYNMRGFSNCVEAMASEGPISDNSASKDNKIHILGVGNLGLFYAHSLAKLRNPPPITLLLHRASLLKDWESVGSKIEITTDGVSEQTSGLQVELVQPGLTDVIENLIIATKTIKTVSAVSSIKHRLTSDSTILFTQNGMGSMDEVTAFVFMDPSTRPKYLTCITSHGVFSQAPFRSVHAGKAHVTIGQTSSEDPAPRYLIDTIVAAKVLAAEEFPSPEILRLQLEKLVVNAMINPLTAIIRCQNGQLFNRKPIIDFMRLMLKEASQVLLSLPELKSDQTTPDRFSEQRLERLVLDVAAKTAKNTSSMLQDVQAGRETEIDYINGYIVKRGKETGIDCHKNELIMLMVKRRNRWDVEQSMMSGLNEPVPINSG